MAGPQDLTDVVFRIVDQSRYTEVQARYQRNIINSTLLQKYIHLVNTRAIKLSYMK